MTKWEDREHSDSILFEDQEEAVFEDTESLIASSSSSQSSSSESLSSASSESSFSSLSSGLAIHSFFTDTDAVVWKDTPEFVWWRDLFPPPTGLKLIP